MTLRVSRLSHQAWSPTGALTNLKFPIAASVVTSREGGSSKGTTSWDHQNLLAGNFETDGVELEGETVEQEADRTFFAPKCTVVQVDGADINALITGSIASAKKASPRGSPCGRPRELPIVCGLTKSEEY